MVSLIVVLRESKMFIQMNTLSKEGRCGGGQYIVAYSYVERFETGSTLSGSTICDVKGHAEACCYVCGFSHKVRSISVAVNP